MFLEFSGPIQYEVFNSDSFFYYMFYYNLIIYSFLYSLGLQFILYKWTDGSLEFILNIICIMGKNLKIIFKLSSRSLVWY